MDMIVKKISSGPHTPNCEAKMAGHLAKSRCVLLNAWPSPSSSHLTASSGEFHFQSGPVATPRTRSISKVYHLRLMRHTGKILFLVARTNVPSKVLFCEVLPTLLPLLKALLEPPGKQNWEAPGTATHTHAQNKQKKPATKPNTHTTTKPNTHTTHTHTHTQRELERHAGGGSQRPPDSSNPKTEKLPSKLQTSSLSNSKQTPNFFSFQARLDCPGWVGGEKLPCTWNGPCTQHNSTKALPTTKEKLLIPFFPKPDRLVLSWRVGGVCKAKASPHWVGGRACNVKQKLHWAGGRGLKNHTPSTFSKALL